MFVCTRHEEKYSLLILVDAMHFLKHCPLVSVADKPYIYLLKHYVRNWHNTLQQCVDIFRKMFLKDKMRWISFSIQLPNTISGHITGVIRERNTLFLVSVSLTQSNIFLSILWSIITQYKVDVPVLFGQMLLRTKVYFLWSLKLFKYFGFGFWCWTPHSTILQLYHGRLYIKEIS